VFLKEREWGKEALILRRQSSLAFPHVDSDKFLAEYERKFFLS
jgi:hypothetical protein